MTKQRRGVYRRNLRHQLYTGFKLVFDVLMGAVIFLAVLLANAGVAVAVHWASAWVHDGSFTDVMTYADKLVRLVDVLFYLWWVVYSTYRAAKEIIR